jgi:hypothetical protein
MIVAARRHFDVRLVTPGRGVERSRRVVEYSRFFSVSMPGLNEAGRRLPRLTEVVASTNHDWHEFAHRCRIAYSRQPSLCDRLVETARTAALLLLHGEDLASQHGAAELKRHLEMLEARRRYDCGWGVGGYTRPVRSEIERLGGLWLNKHKVWAMPDRPSWLHILSLLPGDF